MAPSYTNLSLLPSSSSFQSYTEIILIITSFFFLFLYYKKTRGRSSIPTNWPIAGMLPGLLANLHRLHQWVTDILHETGCTFRFIGPWSLGMDFIVTCDPANVNHVFNANFSNYPKGQEFYEIFDILGDGIFSADDESWKGQRRKAHAAMGSANFRAFVVNCSREKVEGSLVPFVGEIARKGQVVDLQDVFLRLTFDMTCNLVFGVDPGCLSPEFPTVPFAKAMDDAMEALAFRHVLPPSLWKLMRRLGVGHERKLARAQGAIDDFVTENIAKKKKEKGVHKEDILTSYMNSDDKFLRDTTVNLMLAGRDTTGVALTWFFWLLAKHPEVESRILDELKKLVKKDSFLDSPIVFNPENITKLVYLHAAFCESLRLYPSVPFEHKGPVQSDMLPSSVKANAKEKILFCTYSMGRMDGVWGKNCLEFRPERWISEKGTLRHEPSYKFLAFNCGPRTCLGKEIAFIQMKTVAAAMVFNFKTELVEGHVVEPKLSIILNMRNGLKVRIKKRRQLMNVENGN